MSGSGDTPPTGPPAATPPGEALARALDALVHDADETVRGMVRAGFHDLSRSLSQQAHDREPHGFLLADRRLKALRHALEEAVVAFLPTAGSAGEGAGETVGETAGEVVEEAAGEAAGEAAAEEPGAGALGPAPDSTEPPPEPPLAPEPPDEDVTPADPSDGPDPVTRDEPGPEGRSTPAAPETTPGGTTTGPAPVAPEELLRQYLTREFTELTASGSATWEDLVRPELVYGAESAVVPPPDLAGLWRTLHLFALRLPQQDAERSRARWRARAVEHLGEVEGDGLVPALPEIVEALPLRDPRFPMAPETVREHATALLGRAQGEHIEVPEISDELRYVLALIQECARENLLLAENDPQLVAALKILTSGGPVRRLSDDDVMKSYRRLVTDRLADLARSVGLGSQVEPALVRADEVLAALVHDPLARSGSWWQQRRRELQRKLTTHLDSRGTDVQAHEQLTERLTGYGEDEGLHTRDDIMSEVRKGIAILWWLRLPYRTKGGKWEKGRMIHAKYSV